MEKYVHVTNAKPLKVRINPTDSFAFAHQTVRNNISWLSQSQIVTFFALLKSYGGLNAQALN